MVLVLVGLALLAWMVGMLMLPKESYAVGIMAAAVVLTVLARIVQAIGHTNRQAQLLERILQIGMAPAQGIAPTNLVWTCQRCSQPNGIDIATCARCNLSRDPDRDGWWTCQCGYRAAGRAIVCPQCGGPRLTT